MRLLNLLLVTLILFMTAPLGVHAAIWWSRAHPDSWATADWSSTHTLPPAEFESTAMVRIYSARTGRWKGVFATHSWIVLKDRGGDYERWDKVGWGAPVRRNNYAPDARWYGNEPEVIYEARGPKAQALIPQIRAGIAAYRYKDYGDYRVWPGPNSNTFVAAVLARVPELGGVLPPTAIGKDYPADESWVGLTPSRTGVRLSLMGYAGLTLAWVEGIEINLLGAVLGVDIRRPALKLPGFGRIGL